MYSSPDFRSVKTSVILRAHGPLGELETYVF